MVIEVLRQRVLSPSVRCYYVKSSFTYWLHDAYLSETFQRWLQIVETAESESTMSLSEKSMLSSLLIAVLLRNFQYCTDVVLSLLRAHIAKSVHVGWFPSYSFEVTLMVVSLLSTNIGTVCTNKSAELVLERSMIDCLLLSPKPGSINWVKKEFVWK